MRASVAPASALPSLAPRRSLQRPSEILARVVSRGARVPNIGLSELIVILMILLLVFGASRLPQIGESLGRTIRDFKRGISTDDKIEIKKAESLPSPASKPASPTQSDITDAELVDKRS
jgi:sec-independent protein translocase protein TatA